MWPPPSPGLVRALRAQAYLYILLILRPPAWLGRARRTSLQRNVFSAPGAAACPGEGSGETPPALTDSSIAFPATQEATNLRAGQAEPCWHAAESHRRVGRQTDRQGQAGGGADSQTGWQARPEGWDSVQGQAGAMAPACPGQAARHTMPSPRDATPSLQLERGCPAPTPTVTAFSGPRFLGDQLLSLGLPSKQAVLRGPLPSRESRAPTTCLQSGLGAVTYTVGAAGWSGLGLWC